MAGNSRKKKQAEAGDSEGIVAAKTALADFLQRNPSAEIGEVPNSPVRYISRPWGDQSLAIVIPDIDEPFVSTLNNLVLPDRLSAIYHVAERSLEVIFTAYKLPDSFEDVLSRSFSFQFKGVLHQCRFSDSTDALRLIAKNAVFLRSSDTGFRNLQSLSAYENRPRREGGKKATGQKLSQPLDKPRSFFIDNLNWSGEETLDLIRHVNFYLTYYDNHSPFIIVHAPRDDTVVNPRSRYLFDMFPKDIVSRELNPILLSFWVAAADSADTGTKYLLYYRILEFVSTFYLQQDKLSSVRRLLSSPHLGERLSSTIDELVGLVREEKPDNTARFKKMLNELVKSDLIWREICVNPAAFTEETHFDGGFELKPLVANTASRDAFGPRGMETLGGVFRSIRNALAHGGESQSGQVILPTGNNAKRLQPWVHLISVAAGEVVLFEHLT